MLTKLSNSWELVKASARVLQADKELLIFPLISGLAFLVISASFFLPLLATGANLETVASGDAGPLGYVLLFLFYVAQYFVVIFFNSALVGAAMIRLQGGDPTVGDGLRIATQRLGSIFGYAVIAATVGLVLRTLSERAGFLGRLVIGLVGLGWSLATFLVVPVLVTRDVSPVDAIKESAAVLKRTWGEQVVGNVGLGLTFALLFTGLAILSIPVMILAVSTGQAVVIVTAAVVLALTFVLLMLVSAALSGIYSAALYRFATTGQAGWGFESRMLASAFVAKG